MGHLSLSLGTGSKPPSSRPAGGARLTVLLDYRPVMDQVERVQLDLGPEWGPPEVAHAVLVRTRERVELRDAAGDVWPFERATVRAFWTTVASPGNGTSSMPPPPERRCRN